MTRFASIAAFEAALADLGEPDAGAAADARVRQGELTKPAGSLGRLEDLAHEANQCSVKAFRSHGTQIGGTALVTVSPLALREFTRSEEHTSELPSLMRTSYAVCCANKTPQ